MDSHGGERETIREGRESAAQLFSFKFHSVLNVNIKMSAQKFIPRLFIRQHNNNMVLVGIMKLIMFKSVIYLHMPI